MSQPEPSRCWIEKGSIRGDFLPGPSIIAATEFMKLLLFNLFHPMAYGD
jgi:hypothetical protein